MNKYKNILFLTALISLVPANLTGQSRQADEIIIFGNRLISPIEMDVQKSQNKIIFSVNNKSYFPYEFELEFNEFQNLTPSILSKKVILQPGFNRLFTLNVVKENEMPRYDYSTRFVLGNPNLKADLVFPYLIPVGDEKKVELVKIQNNKETHFQNNRFRMRAGDSFCAIRKGIVTALPDNKTEVDRIIRESSLEVRHFDGSIAVYLGASPQDNLLKLGQTIYPGQPIGKIDSAGILDLSVYIFKGVGMVKSIDISYINGNESYDYPNKKDGLVIEYPITKIDNGLTVKYPRAIIEKEMTKRELKKFNKGTLYSK